MSGSPTTSRPKTGCVWKPWATLWCHYRQERAWAQFSRSVSCQTAGDWFPIQLGLGQVKPLNFQCLCWSDIFSCQFGAVIRIPLAVGKCPKMFLKTHHIPTMLNWIWNKWGLRIEVDISEFLLRVFARALFCVLFEHPQLPSQPGPQNHPCELDVLVRRFNGKSLHRFVPSIGCNLWNRSYPPRT